MAVENENVDNENEDKQPQGEEVNPLASTGSEQWDKIIDDAAGTGEKKDVNAGKSTVDTSAKKDDLKQQQIDPNNKTPDNTQQQRQEPTQNPSNQQTRAVARKYGNLFQAGVDGNIYDTNGGLIAKQGMQRSIFHRIYPTIEAQARELGGLRETVKNYESANAIAQKEGLTLDEHGAALQMFVQYKKDPVKTLTTLLTLAEQAGRDVSTIRQATGPSLADFRAAVTEEVAKAVQPFSFLTEQQKVQQEQQLAYEEVQNQYAEFIEEFPDAVTHTDALANVMRDKDINAREAYYAVRAFAATRGLDWTKPLAPQLVAQEQVKSNPSGDGQNRRQLPRMGGRNPREDTHVENGALDQANANDSWDAIAKRAMAKHGIAI